MTALLLVLFLISSSNCAKMEQVEIDGTKMTKLDLSTTEETYFYVRNTNTSGKIYFHFIDYTCSYSIIDICYTDIKPDNRTSPEGCYGNRSLTLQKSEQRKYLLEEYYKYNYNIQKEYFIIEYKVKNTNKTLEVNASYNDIYEYINSDKSSNGYIVLVVIIIVPLILIALIVVCVVALSRFCRKKFAKPINYTRPPTNLAPNPASAYNPMINQAPAIEENLLYSKPT